jgi:hypothetical protein
MKGIKSGTLWWKVSQEMNGTETVGAIKIYEKKRPLKYRKSSIFQRFSPLPRSAGRGT